MKQRVLIGPGTSINLGMIIKEYNPKTILLIRGKNSYSINGAEDSIKNALYGMVINVIDYFDFQENPKIEDVERGLRLMNENKVDLIVAIGGGSTMDMAKLIRFFYSYNCDKEFKNYDFIQKLVPLITLPTTSGTGSEATHFAVVYKNKIKYSVTHEMVLPDISIVDSIFTYKNRPYLTACTGFDALAQAIEAFWNVNATEESDEYSIKAISLIWENLPVAVHYPTELVRDKISEGAHWAGKAINITKTTAPHAFSYPFTTFYGYPHGHAVAMTFPAFIRVNYGDNYCKLAINSDRNHCEKMDKLYKILLIPNKSEAYKIMRKYINSLGLSLKRPDNFTLSVVTKNINIQRLDNNPIIINEQMAKSIVLYNGETDEELLETVKKMYCFE